MYARECASDQGQLLAGLGGHWHRTSASTVTCSGSRPSLGDFGMFGQLKTLATDTSPMLEMRGKVPMVEHWLRQMDRCVGR